MDDLGVPPFQEISIWIKHDQTIHIQPGLCGGRRCAYKGKRSAFADEAVASFSTRVIIKVVGR